MELVQRRRCGERWTVDILIFEMIIALVEARLQLPQVDELVLLLLHLELGRLRRRLRSLRIDVQNLGAAHRNRGHRVKLRVAWPRHVRRPVHCKIGRSAHERLAVVIAEYMVDQHVLAVLLVQQSGHTPILLELALRLPPELRVADVIIRLREGHSLDLQVLPRLLLLSRAELYLAERTQMGVEPAPILERDCALTFASDLVLGYGALNRVLLLLLILVFSYNICVL